VFRADEDLRVVLGATDFGPFRPWIGTAKVFLVDGPGPRQGVVDDRDFVVQHVWICLVDVDALLEDGLIVVVQRQAGEVVDARLFERPARLDFKSVVVAVVVLVDRFAARATRICRWQVGRTVQFGGVVYALLV